MSTLTTQTRCRTGRPRRRPTRPGQEASGGDRVFNGVLAGSSAAVFSCWPPPWCSCAPTGLGSPSGRIRPLHGPDLVPGLPSLRHDVPAGRFHRHRAHRSGTGDSDLLATALMINEYAPRRLKPLLTGMVDMLATVPSIVYGFWGLLVVSDLQAAPAVARWTTPASSHLPNSVARAIREVDLRLRLICAVTIIPIITSISREVMSQMPRDVCEAALGLGGTRWGMVTDVILPFSRNGILGAVLCSGSAGGSGRP